MLLEHYSEVPYWSWPNFKPLDMACPCCGEAWFDPNMFDMLQFTRSTINEPLYLGSSHRCPIHNAFVGGVALSKHKEIAFDISTIGKDREKVYSAAKLAGFGSFGFYQTFIHVDNRPGKSWFGGKIARKIWKPFLVV